MMDRYLWPLAAGESWAQDSLECISLYESIHWLVHTASKCKSVRREKKKMKRTRTTKHSACLTNARQEAGQGRFGAIVYCRVPFVPCWCVRFAMATQRSSGMQATATFITAFTRQHGKLRELGATPKQSHLGTYTRHGGGLLQNHADRV